VFLTEFSQLVLVSQQASMAEAGPVDASPAPLLEEASNELVLAGPQN
jgi:hypothetical protein